MPKETTKQIGFRCPTKLRNEITKLAEAERRSVNAQILALVEEALAARRAAAPKR